MVTPQHKKNEQHHHHHHHLFPNISSMRFEQHQKQNHKQQEKGRKENFVCVTQGCRSLQWGFWHSSQTLLKHLRFNTRSSHRRERFLYYFGFTDIPLNPPTMNKLIFMVKNGKRDHLSPNISTWLFELHQTKAKAKKAREKNKLHV